MNFNIQQFLTSLFNDIAPEDETNHPDALVDCSAIAEPLLRITRDGRALHSETPYGYAKFISELLHEYLGENPGITERDRCIAGISILLVMVMRQTTVFAPDWRPEEFLIDLASQDAVRELMSEMRNIPAKLVNGALIPNFAQMPIFHRPIPVSDEVLKGFISRRIAPHFPLNNEPLALDEVEIIDDLGPSTRKVDLNDVGPLEADPLNDFDDFYSEFFDNEDDYLDESDDFSDDD